MRIVIAALLGAVMMFLWGFVAHMLLPIGEMGMHQPQNEDVVLQAVTTGLPTPGIYMLPSIDSAKMSDEAVIKPWVDKVKANPFVYLVVSPSIGDPTAMGPQLTKQFISDFVGSLILAFVLAATVWGFGMRVIGSAAIGVFGWVATVVPQWTWYRFPTDYVFGGFLEQSIGWLLAGIAIAWWLGRK